MPLCDSCRQALTGCGPKTANCWKVRNRCATRTKTNGRTNRSAHGHGPQRGQSWPEPPPRLDRRGGTPPRRRSVDGIERLPIHGTCFRATERGRRASDWNRRQAVNCHGSTSHPLHRPQGAGKNKLRAGLTMLGVIIGIAAVTAMVSLGQYASGLVHRELEGIGTNVVLVFPGSRREGARAGDGAAPISPPRTRMQSYESADRWRPLPPWSWPAVRSSTGTRTGTRGI